MNSPRNCSFRGTSIESGKPNEWPLNAKTTKIPKFGLDPAGVQATICDRGISPNEIVFKEHGAKKLNFKTFMKS